MFHICCVKSKHIATKYNLELKGAFGYHQYLFGSICNLAFKARTLINFFSQVSLIEEAIRKGIGDADSEARAAVRRYVH